mgnify:CR=1 FL=1|jgi:hypothetical protein
MKGPITLVYFNKEDADFLSYSTCLYTEDFHLELARGELPNGKSKPVMHFYEDQISALTAYKIFKELDMDVSLSTAMLQDSMEWVVIVDDPKEHAKFLSS